jgi:hypothetical protein
VCHHCHISSVDSYQSISFPPLRVPTNKGVHRERSPPGHYVEPADSSPEELDSGTPGASSRNILPASQLSPGAISSTRTPRTRKTYGQVPGQLGREKKTRVAEEAEKRQRSSSEFGERGSHEKFDPENNRWVCSVGLIVLRD